MKITGKFEQPAVAIHEEQTSSAMVIAQGNQKPWKPRCYFCGQPGHLQCKCPKRRDYSSPEAVHKAKTAEEKCPKSNTINDNSDSETADSVEAFTASVSSAT